MIDCIEWEGYKRNGYGLTHHKGKTVSVHRLEYEKHHGPIPEGLVVRHKCDNRACYNIEHLELGTHKDNIHDAISRGRFRGGWKLSEETRYENGRKRAILTDDQVKEIRAKLKERGDKYGVISGIAREYNVSRSTISRIKNEPEFYRKYAL